jgi:hypothetical protein
MSVAIVELALLSFRDRHVRHRADSSHSLLDHVATRRYAEEKPPIRRAPELRQDALRARGVHEEVRVACFWERERCHRPPSVVAGVVTDGVHGRLYVKLRPLSLHVSLGSSGDG